MTTIHIRGMQCQHCAGAVQQALEALGATEVQVEVAKGEARFEGTLDPHEVRRAIAAQGFEVVD